MRKHKYRIWDIEQKCFWYWDFTKNYPQCLTKEYIEENAQEYSGKKDKNNKEIYEEDIVKGVFEDEITIGVIKFGSHNCTASDPFEAGTGYGFYLYYEDGGEEYTEGLLSFNEIEVIGNTKNHSKLLKEK